MNTVGRHLDEKLCHEYSRMTQSVGYVRGEWRVEVGGGGGGGGATELPTSPIWDNQLFFFFFFSSSTLPLSDCVVLIVCWGRWE